MVKLHINKNHALLTFAESLSGKIYVSKAPKEIYLKKYANDIDKFVKLHKKVSEATIYRYVSTRSLLEALYFESLKYQNFNDFRGSIYKYKTTLTKAEIKKYFKYLEKLLFRYEKLIWNKTYKKLLFLKKELKNVMIKENFNSLIVKVANFYGVKVKDLDMIDVAFYPISYGQQINAYSIKNTETIGIFTNEKQSYNWILTAIILHEIAHTIYAKSEFVKNNFLKLNNETRETTINEILATVVGAGWGYKQLSKEYAHKPWYSNRIYDRGAKKLYPKIIKYFNSNKKIDKEFAIYMKELVK